MKCLNEILALISDIESDRLEPEGITSIWDFEDSQGQIKAMQFMLDKVFGEEE